MSSPANLETYVVSPYRSNYCRNGVDHNISDHPHVEIMTFPSKLLQNPDFPTSDEQVAYCHIATGDLQDENGLSESGFVYVGKGIWSKRPYESWSKRLKAVPAITLIIRRPGPYLKANRANNSYEGFQPFDESQVRYLESAIIEGLRKRGIPRMNANRGSGPIWLSSMVHTHDLTYLNSISELAVNKVSVITARRDAVDTVQIDRCVKIIESSPVPLTTLQIVESLVSQGVPIGENLNLKRQCDVVGRNLREYVLPNPMNHIQAVNLDGKILWQLGSPDSKPLQLQVGIVG